MITMDKIRWGVIGCGGIARKRTLPGFLLAENSECVAVVSASASTVDAVAEEFHIGKRYYSVDELLADPQIDAVYIASPLRNHKEQIIAAAKAGKHILCEKPMCLTVEDEKEMEKFCREQGVKLGVGFMMRFHGAHEEMKRIIASGGIGEIVSAYAVFNSDYPANEKLWRQSKANSAGGAMMDMGIHCIDLLRYISGMDAQLVTAVCGNQIHKYPDVEDAGTVVMRMDNGAIFTVQANFNIPDAVGGCSFMIMGRTGSLTAMNTVGQTSTGTLYHVDLSSGSAESRVIPYSTDNMYARELDAFSKAIIGDTLPPVGAGECIKDQSIIEAAYRSSELGVHEKL